MPSTLYEPNPRRTAIVASGQTVTEGRLVSIAGPQITGVTGSKLPQVQHTTAGARCWGWAETGGVAGERITVVLEASVPVPATANITGGAQVEVSTAGQVVTLASGIAVGVAEDSVSSGADCPVTLY